MKVRSGTGILPVKEAHHGQDGRATCVAQRELRPTEMRLIGWQPLAVYRARRQARGEPCRFVKSPIRFGR